MTITTNVRVRPVHRDILFVLVYLYFICLVAEIHRVGQIGVNFTPTEERLGG